MVTRDWIVEWFSKNISLPAATIMERSGQNYFELGYVDSFGFIGFLSDLEEHLGFEFDNSQFEDRRFATIDGLCEIIEEWRSGKV